MPVNFGKRSGALTELDIQPSDQDTYFYESSQNQSYGNSTLFQVYDKDTFITRPIIQFTHNLAGVKVVGATLYLCTVQALVAALETVNVYCRRLTRNNWLEGTAENPSTVGATWLDYRIDGGAHSQWTTPGGDYVQSAQDDYVPIPPDQHWDQWDTWNVKHIVQKSIDDGWTTVHFLLHSDRENEPGYFGSQWQFHSSEALAAKRPRLVIAYRSGGGNRQPYLNGYRVP